MSKPSDGKGPLLKELERLREENESYRELYVVERARRSRIEEAAREVWNTPGFAGAVPQTTIERLRAALEEKP